MRAAPRLGRDQTDAGTGEAELLVRLDGVERTYGSGAAAVAALRGVTCSVSAGVRLAVTGPSGSGKSTLLQLMAGLDEPKIPARLDAVPVGQSKVQHDQVEAAGP